MPNDPPLSLQEFLLAYAVSAPPEGVVPRQRGTADPETLALQSLRAEVLRHSDRTMTVVSMTGTVTLTGCRVCAWERTGPCRALRLLALPFAAHPAYRREWHIDDPSLAVVVEDRGH